MEYRELLKSAITALRSNILRTALTMLGIIIGITSVILIVSIGQGAVAFVTNELTSFGTNLFRVIPGNDPISSLTGVDTLTFEDAEAIKNDTSLTNIENIAPFSVSTVTVSANGEQASLMIYGVKPELLNIFKPDIIDGEFISEDNEINAERIVVVGTDAKETFFGENADIIGETVYIDNKSFRVIGEIQSDNEIAGSFLNNTFYIPLSVARTQLPGGDRIIQISFSVYDAEQLNQTMEDVELFLRDRHNLEEGEESDFQVHSFQDVLSTVQTITNLLTLMVAAISAISLIVGGVGVMNIMLVSVTERTKEIGLLKAIGAKQKDILAQFLIEAAAMTLIGGIIGVLIGISGAFLISLAVGIPFVISVPAVVAAVGVSTLVGIVFGLYPARRAARLNVIDALRYE